MARFTSWIVSALSLLYTCNISGAAPLDFGNNFSLNNNACIAAQIQVSNGLQIVSQDLQRIAVVPINDAALAQLLAIIQGGLNQAQNGINLSAQAILAGIGLPQQARDLIAQGLTDAQNALNAIVSNNAVLLQLVAQAQVDLNNTIIAAIDVLNNCGVFLGQGSLTTSLFATDSIATSTLALPTATVDAGACAPPATVTVFVDPTATSNIAPELSAEAAVETAVDSEGNVQRRSRRLNRL